MALTKRYGGSLFSISPLTMHVLVVALSFPSPEHPYRGAFIGEQVRLLSDHLERITVICPTTYVPNLAKRGQAAAQASIPLRYEFVKDRCEVLFPRYLKMPGSAFLWWTKAQWCRLVSNTVAELAQTRPVSLIHANAGSVSSWSAIQVGKRYGIPCVVTYQGSEVHTTLAHRQKGWKLCRDSFRLADLNISVSRSLERILKAHAQPQGRCEVMLRGVDLRMFFPSPGQDARRPIVLFVGRISEAKGIFDLLEAWTQVVARCSNAELWVVGPDCTNGRFARETRSCGFGSSVRASAPLPLPDVAELMRQAQVLCLPSHGEGTPNVVMEALASGLPVVATKVGGIPDIVDSNRTGILVQQGDVQGLADALVSLLRDSDCRARMGEAAHEFARTHLDARKTVLRLAGLYRELITASRGNDDLAAGYRQGDETFYE